MDTDSGHTYKSQLKFRDVPQTGSTGGQVVESSNFLVPTSSINSKPLIKPRGFLLPTDLFKYYQIYLLIPISVPQIVYPNESCGSKKAKKDDTL